MSLITLAPSYFFFSCYCDLRDLHSFPTRRSSDLEAAGRLRPHVRDDTSGNGRTMIVAVQQQDRKSTRLNSSHLGISYAVFCLKKKKRRRRKSEKHLSLDLYCARRSRSQQPRVDSG